MNKKFHALDIVQIKSSNPEYFEINTFEGEVMGSLQKNNGSWEYVVYAGKKIWHIDESELVGTGKVFSNY